MNSDLEKKIFKLLSSTSDPVGVADQLISDERLLRKDENLKSVVSFVINSGSHKRAADLLFDRNSKGQRLPWSELGHLVQLADLDLSDDEQSAILEGAKEEGELEGLLTQAGLEKLVHGFRELRAAALSRQQLEFAEKKIQLREQLDFFRTNRMYEQEAKVLDEIQLLFPNEPEFANERDELEVRLAREILQSSPLSDTDPSLSIERKMSRLNEEQQAFKALLLERCFEITTAGLESMPYVIEDMAILLHFMEFNRDAVELIESFEYRKSPWLKLELMLKARQYATALDECSMIEIELAGNPEAVFAVTYARARALWGLGQSRQAIELLTSLARVRPNYKSVQSLLTDWTGGGDLP